MSTEMPSLREVRQSVASKLAAIPAADHNGRTAADAAADAATVAVVTAAMADPEPAAQGGMHRNRAQGHSGAAVDAPPPSNPLEAVRRQVAKHGN